MLSSKSGMLLMAGHGDFGQLERDVASVPYHFGADLDQLLTLGGERPVPDLLRWVLVISMTAVGQKPPSARQNPLPTKPCYMGARPL